MEDLLPLNNIDEELLKKLKIRFSENRYRSLTIHNSNHIDFASNDYLGLARPCITYKPETYNISYLNTERFLQKKHFKDCGSTGSRLISGNYNEILNLESILAEFHKTEKALIFSSGYAANLSLFSTLPDRHSTVLYDELIHASMRDGIRLGFCKSAGFKHNDINDLKKKLSIIKSDRKVFIAVESLYSMDGDYAPLSELVSLCRGNKNIFLIVDEAHTSGISGSQGEGLIVSLGLEQYVYARVHTFGKAYGSHGAAIAGSSILINYIINFSRQFIYTTAPSPEFVDSLKLAFLRVISASTERQKLIDIQNYSRTIFRNFFNGLVDDGGSHIKYILIKEGNKKCKEISDNLLKEGIFIKPILSPTVKKGTERLRICLHSFNTEEEIDYLVEKLLKYIPVPVQNAQKH